MSTRGVRPGMLRQKENNPADAQAGKRLRTAVGAGSGRQPLSAAPAPPPPPEDEPMVFAGREDVESLLNEKMKGKNKMDYKGKSEQMMEYIKRLRGCIKWLLEREDANLIEICNISGRLEAEGKQHSETVAELKNAIDDARSINEELQKQYASLQQIQKEVEAEKMDALRNLADEKTARMAVESLRNELLEDAKKNKLEEKRLTDQIKMLQDTNKRLQEYNTSLQQYNSNLQADVIKNAETIAKLQKEKNTMVETMNGLKDHANSVKMQLDLAKSLQSEAAKQKNDLLKEVEGLRMELQHVREDRENKSAQVDSLMAEIGTYKEMSGKTAMELDGAMTRTSALEETCSSQRDTIKTLEIKLAVANERLKELKGNIRVFCRVRPLLPNESGAVSYPKSGENIGRGIELMHNAQAYSFTFDKVFDHSASQEHVFIEISQLVQSALDGYKVCIFAYGQTGSGKTHTMMGNPELQDQKGMIPRSLEQIFQASQALNSQGWKYKMQASMLEIYNETIRDLLAVNRTSAQDGGSSKYIIKHDASGNTHVSDLTVVDGTDQQVQGVLNLIDLAGSERLNKSGATGDRLKETQAINKSLSCLSDVIFSIAKKEEHVPFRNSKLTYLLQPCLGGDSKTLMFVNLSPEASSTGESICSLRFAARVNSCEIGIPRRQTQMRSS
nr:unnamed protein product [Digitaria exilis]